MAYQKLSRSVGKGEVLPSTDALVASGTLLFLFSLESIVSFELEEMGVRPTQRVAEFVTTSAVKQLDFSLSRRRLSLPCVSSFPLRRPQRPFWLVPQHLFSFVFLPFPSAPFFAPLDEQHLLLYDDVPPLLQQLVLQPPQPRGPSPLPLMLPEPLRKWREGSKPG